MMDCIPDSLSARDKTSFAYTTIKNRLPVILTRIIDSVYRKKDIVKEKHGQEAADVLKTINGKLSQLRYEIQTNKPLIQIEDGQNDNDFWKNYLEELTSLNNGPPLWFNDSWLYVECYMYRKIVEIFNNCPIAGEIVDPYREQKETSFLNSAVAIDTIITCLHSNKDVKDLKEIFIKFFKVALWGNKCDLSISALAENAKDVSPLSELDSLEANILADETDSVWKAIERANSAKPGNVRIDIILDNAGFELIGDLCLAEFLLSRGIAQTVVFHGKSYPWFISDVTEHDFNWTLNMISGNSHQASLGKLWKERLLNESWKYVTHKFWTLSVDYSEMSRYCPDLYRELGESDLVILKGDLNYRKLTGDRQWDTTVPFHKTLRGFHPASLCVLRTLKSDTVTGLKEGVADATREKDIDWMVTGKYAVIQFCDKVPK